MSAEHHGRRGRPWRRLREQVLREEPYCQIRGRGCQGRSTTVDHIVPLSIAPRLAHVRSNLRGACAHCNYSTGAAMGNRRRGVPPRPKVRTKPLPPLPTEHKPYTDPRWL